MESLSEKLKSLGVKKGVTDTPSKQAPQPVRAGYDIATVIQGQEYSSPFGFTFYTELVDPALRDPGSAAYFDPAMILREWAGISRDTLLAPGDYVFLDTETSGLAGGTGTFVFMVGLGFVSQAGFKVLQLFLRDPGEEAAFLAALASMLAPFKAVVTFNGKSFDAPLLNARHVLNGFDSPLARLQHIDLLPLARRIWRNRLSSRALKDLEVAILGQERTVEEVPGYLSPEIYYEYLHSGDARPLAGVFYHNAQDILSLHKLFLHLGNLLADPIRVSPEEGLDLIAVARLYEDLKHWDWALKLYEHSLGSGLPVTFYLDTVKRYANLYRKQENWTEAALLWQKAVDYHQVDACIELAKLKEHQERDPAGALQWVQTALSYLPEVRPVSLRKALREELEHRAERLSQKLAKSAGQA